MAPHSSVLAWRILWTEEPGGLLFMGSHRVGHDWSDLACMHTLEKEMATHSSVFGWRIPGTEEPGGLPSMGSHRAGHDWSNLAAAAASTKSWKCAILFRCCHLPSHVSWEPPCPGLREQKMTLLINAPFPPPCSPSCQLWGSPMESGEGGPLLSLPGYASLLD